MKMKMKKTDTLNRLREIFGLCEARKMTAAEYSKLSPKQRAEVRKLAKSTAEKHTKAASKAATKPSKVAKKPAKAQAKPAKAPEAAPEPPSVGDLLLKGDVNMGTLRSFTNNIHPSYRGAFHKHLAYHPQDHGAFNSDPHEYFKGWLHGVKATNQRNPRTTPSLAGGKFGNMDGK
jgi:hypothetical protein